MGVRQCLWVEGVVVFLAFLSFREENWGGLVITVLATVGLVIAVLRGVGRGASEDNGPS